MNQSKEEEMLIQQGADLSLAFMNCFFNLNPKLKRVVFVHEKTVLKILQLEKEVKKTARQVKVLNDFFRPIFDKMLNFAKGTNIRQTISDLVEKMEVHCYKKGWVVSRSDSPSKG